MRRTLVSTKGFHAPRTSGGSASGAHAAPPPPPAPAPPQASASASSPKSSVAAPTRLSNSRKSAPSPAKTSARGSAAAAAASAGAAAAVGASSGVASSGPAARGLLSGHFSANHHRRAATRREEPPTPTRAGSCSSSSTATTTTGAPHGSAATRVGGSSSAASAARVAAVSASRLSRERREEYGEQGGEEEEVAWDGQPAARKRARSSSPASTGSDADRDDPPHGRDGPARDESAPLADLFLPRLPTARRLSTAHVPRHVFYPPSAEQPIAAVAAPAAHDAVVGPALADQHRTRDDSSEVGRRAEAASSRLPPAAPHSVSAESDGELTRATAAVVTRCAAGERDSTAHAGFVFQTPPSPSFSPSAATTATAEAAASSPPPTPSHATRFLSALAHQRRDGAGSGGGGGPSFPPSTAFTASSASSTPYGVASASGVGTGEPCTPPATATLPSATHAVHIAGTVAAAEGPPPPPPSSSSSESREASLLRSTSSSQPASPPAPPTAAPHDGAAAGARIAEPAPHALVDAVHAPRAVPSATTATTATTAAAVRAAATMEDDEEQEREESDAALAREVAEDLRLSMDAAFTPSATGTGAPPHFSQSSAMQEDEEGAEGRPSTARVDVFGGSRHGSGGDLGARAERGVAGDGSGPVHGSTPSSSSPHQQGSVSGLLIAGSPHAPPVPGPARVSAGASSSSAESIRCAVTAASMSAPATWPIREPTPPRVGAMPAAAGVGLLPLGPLAAATGAVRHRTVFSFSSVRAPAPPQAESPPAEGRAAGNSAAAAAASSAVCEDVHAVAVADSGAPMPMMAESPSLSSTPVAPPPPPPPLVGFAAEVWRPTPSSSPPRESASTPHAAMLHVHPAAVEPARVQPEPPHSSASEPPAAAAAAAAPPPLAGSDAALRPPAPSVTAVSAVVSAWPAPAVRPGRTCFTLRSATPAPAALESAPPIGVAGEPRGAVGTGAAAQPPSLDGLAEGVAPGHPAVSSAAAGDGLSSAMQQSSAATLVPLAAQPPPPPPPPPRADSQRRNAMYDGEEDASFTSAIAAVPPPADIQPPPPPPPPTTAPLWPQDEQACAPMPPPFAAITPFVDRLNAAAAAVQQPAAAEPRAAPTTLPQEAIEPAAHDDEEARALLYGDRLEHQTQSEPSPAARPPPPPTSTPPAAPRSEFFYDLPREVGAFYAAQRGVTKLYDWQHELLTSPEVRHGGSFIYSLPTSGGKTLVAELSLLRCVLNRRKSCFLVLPFVSLAEEKTAALQPLTSVFDFAVDGHYGSAGRFPLCEAPAIYVCTIEKANSLLNHMLEEGRTDEIGAAVVDELHMVGESRRGATLELFLSKLLMIDTARHEAAAAGAAASTQRGGSGASAAVVDWEAEWALAEAEAADAPAHVGGTPAAPTTAPGATRPTAPDAGPLQIIGMSATVPNLRTLARWLRAACFERDFRPVPLHAYSVVGGMVLRDGQHNERNLCGSTVTQHLLELATELPDASVLVFCASRQQCVDTARGIVNYLKAQAIAGQQQQLPAMEPGEASHVTVMGVPIPGLPKGRATAAAVAALPPVHASSPAIRSLLADLEALAHYEASQLSEIVPSGVAFHHGGLLAEERDLIETAFRRKHVRILCCTSTLAAGVNLPARRVIIKTPYVGREFLTKSRYLQMCGRAGRAGLDPYGESYLLLSRRDQSRGHALMHASVEPCCSQIFEDSQTLTRSLLECVGVGLVADRVGATAWGDALLSRWAVGPVAGSWQAHMTAALSPNVECASAAAPNTVRGGAEDERSTGAARTTAAVEEATAEHSEDSRSLPPPPAPASPPPPPPPPQPLGTANFSCVPPVAMTAVLRLALLSLARCGLIRVSTPVAVTAEVEDGGEGGVAAGMGGKSASAALTLAAAAEAEALLSGAFADAGDAVAQRPAVQVRATPFGSSAVRSCFSVEEALLLRDELEELRHTGLILSDDLHLCYFLTPLREVGECDWALLRLMMSRMSDSRQRIAGLLGVDAYFIDQQAMGLGGPMQATEEGRRRLFTAKRFYVALMLADVLAEVPMAVVEQRYSVNRGQLQNLMRSASMFSSSITSFCHAMEWYSLEAVLSSFVKRLGFGVKPDLLPLMEIRGMQPPRARALWNAGFKKLALIAAADADDMVAKVKSMNPPDSKAAKFFTKRSALMAIREANIALQSQIQEKKGELQELTVRGGHGVLRGVR